MKKSHCRLFAVLHFITSCILTSAALASPPLLDAAERNDLVAVKSLLEKGAKPYEANRYNVTALSLACRNGNPEMTKLLLKAGASITPPKSEPILFTATRTGQAECISALLAAGADPNQKGNDDQTPLMWAAASGHSTAVQILLNAKADPKTQLDSGFDALFFAVRAGHRDITQQLLAAGIDVNSTRSPERANATSMRSNTSALLLAVENGHLQLALELVTAGADPNDQRSGLSPLHALVTLRRAVRGDGADGIPPPRGSGNVVSLDFVRKIIAAGAKVNLPLTSGNGSPGGLNKKGATPFLLACQTGDLELMKLLLELGADPKIPNADNSTALLAATGLDVPAPGEEPASEEDAIAAAKLLLELGADIHHVDNNGETVMHCAAYKSAPKLIHFLDAQGADITRWNKKNKQGRTPLLIAQGFRPGNFRPIQYTIDAISQVMRKNGVEPPPYPPPPGR